MSNLTLISHELCPYVQRAAIALLEKGAKFERINIDLANKPEWFLKISPLGKVPLLKVGETVLFESAVICEYLEETIAPALHPADALKRAEHRGWVEYSSTLLGDLFGFYTAPDATTCEVKKEIVLDKLARVEARLVGPWFDGERFCLVDAIYGPVMRYFEVFDALGVENLLSATPKLAAWRKALLARPSVNTAVAADFTEKMAALIAARNGYIAQKKAA
jgi:glutathione S-transferase